MMRTAAYSSKVTDVKLVVAMNVLAVRRSSCSHTDVVIESGDGVVIGGLILASLMSESRIDHEGIN